jgi:hypothetical protein
MLGHKQDEPNPKRFNLINEGAKMIDTQGLNSIEYKLVQIIKRPLYTKFLIYYNESKILNNTRVGGQQ